MWPGRATSLGRISVLLRRFAIPGIVLSIGRSVGGSIRQPERIDGRCAQPKLLGRAEEFRTRGIGVRSIPGNPGIEEAGFEFRGLESGIAEDCGCRGSPRRSLRFTVGIAEAERERRLCQHHVAH